MSGAWPNIGAAFVVGLLSSLHCIGMCGPLVSLGCKSAPARRMAFGPLLFALGKLGSYTVLGLAAGFLGATLSASGFLGRATAYISLGGGVLMLLVIAVSRLKISVLGTVRLSSAMAKFSLRSGNLAPLFLGIGAALLPCGLLYAMVARSAAAAEPITSMALMQAFGLGTSPALVGLGTLLRAIPQKWSRFGALAGEIVLALTAVVLIVRGIIGIVAAATGQSCCH
jgi:hypothetical protein